MFISSHQDHAPEDDLYEAGSLEDSEDDDEAEDDSPPVEPVETASVRSSPSLA